MLSTSCKLVYAIAFDEPAHAQLTDVSHRSRTTDDLSRAFESSDSRATAQCMDVRGR